MAASVEQIFAVGEIDRFVCALASTVNTATRDGYLVIDEGEFNTPQPFYNGGLYHACFGRPALTRAKDGSTQLSPASGGGFMTQLPLWLFTGGG